jgi:hypothetical protein
MTTYKLDLNKIKQQKLANNARINANAPRGDMLEAYRPVNISQRPKLTVPQQRKKSYQL